MKKKLKQLYSIFIQLNRTSHLVTHLLKQLKTYTIIPRAQLRSLVVSYLCWLVPQEHMSLLSAETGLE